MGHLPIASTVLSVEVESSAATGSSATRSRRVWCLRGAGAASRRRYFCSATIVFTTRWRRPASSTSTM